MVELVSSGGGRFFSTVTQYWWLIPVGFIVGTFGTLVGAGGGFILMPVLLLLYPGERPEIITSISLAVVFFNALSGSVAYARMKRIDYKSGWLFSIASVPGAILGALTTGYIPRQLFDAIFGVLMVVVSVFLLVRPNNEKTMERTASTPLWEGSFTAGGGANHTYSYSPIKGAALIFFVGYISSVLGIGGGIIHVPALVHLLNFPVHIATATSHFVLAITSLTGTLVHIATGTFSHGVRRTICLSIGVLIGAQLGARLSTRVQGKWIIRGLAIGLGFVGIRILIMVL